jgi:hypothetical protein
LFFCLESPIINPKGNFQMSLEQALADNTAAINNLIAVWSKLNATANHVAAVAQPGDTLTAAGKPVAEVKPKAESKKVEAPKPESAAAPSTQEAPAAQTASSPEPTESADAGVTYAQARELVLKLAATNRDAIKAINTKHGIAKLSALLKDENDFASVIDQAKLEAVYADLAALTA